MCESKLTPPKIPHLHQVHPQIRILPVAHKAHISIVCSKNNIHGIQRWPYSRKQCVIYGRDYTSHLDI